MNEFQPEIEDDDDGMTRMVNVSDDSIVVRISQGRRVTRVRVNPGQSHLFPAGYCEDVRGAGRQVLLPILTRQSLREDAIPRLVREEQAEEARAYFVDRVHGTQDDAVSEIDRLRAELAAAEARASVLGKAKAKPETQAVDSKPLKRMNLGQLQELAADAGINPEQTKAQLIAALEEAAE